MYIGVPEHELLYCVRIFPEIFVNPGCYGNSGSVNQKKSKFVVPLEKVHTAVVPNIVGGWNILLQCIISERELTFTFAICYRPSVCRL